ncbi:MAG TPA: S8 family serine peptidase [Actinomycetota bacterium]|nr:S8 family serine peptidase [Micrococcales bacterium]HPQ83074.1 S8 family serine peptidase [Actinomycetota bacterium]
MLGPRSMATAAAVAVVAGLCAAPAGATQTPSEHSAIPHEEVVGLVLTRERGTSAAQAEDLVAAAVDQPTDRSPVAAGVTAVSVPRLDSGQAERLAQELEKQDGVESVEVDTRVRPDAVNDPDFDKQWSLTDALTGVGALPAWTAGTGSGQVIAIVDTGITDHPDLDANVVSGYDLVTDEIVANDGDSRDADPADPGDWVSAEDTGEHPDQFSGCSIQSSSWHGTHVAGIAAAVQNNGVGITGLAPGAKIQPVRALGKCGGTMSDVAAAITWASGGDVPGTPVNPTPADVINLSVSSDSVCQPFLQSAIDGALSRGSSVVVSAGNRGAAFTQASPAGCYDVLAVGAVTRSGDRAFYSNFGVAGRDLPVFAPGGVTGGAEAAILSTWNEGDRSPGAAGYTAYRGTSMAAPLVSAAAALLRSRTGLGPAAIAQHLRNTSRPFPTGSNCSGSCGAGMVDVDAALREATRAPGAPAEVTATASDGVVVASWEAPMDPGGAPVSGYDVQLRAASGQWQAYGNIWPSTLRQRVLGDLTNGVTYQVRVAAHNVFGTGDWRESNVVTPLALPGSVQIRSVQYPSKTSVRLGLSLPLDPLTGTQYRLSRPNRSATPWRAAPASSQVTIARLRAGVRYTVEVRGLNALGAGPAARRAIATPTKPGKVRALKAVRKGKRLTVRWREPKRTGLMPRYRLRVAGVTRWQRTKKTAVTVKRVGVGPVRVQVQSLNETGKGPIRSLTKRK